MSASSAQLEEKLRRDLQPDFLEVIDESASHAGHAGVLEMQASGVAQMSHETHSDPGAHGTHFRIKISSKAFENLSRVSKHRLVYACIQNFIDAGVHAVAIEWV